MTEHQNAFHRPKGTYLLSHSVGLLPKDTPSQASLFFELWKAHGAFAWDEWLSIISAFCQSLSLLLQGHPDEFCPQTNISSALVKILYSLPVRKSRHKIVLSELDFPSAGFVLQAAQKLGYTLQFIPPCHDGNPLALWEQALTDDVQLAFITHVYSENSALNPVEQITALARHKHIFSIVDIAQSVGVIPIELLRWSADFVLGCSVKWLCGGPGASFMWVNPNQIHHCSPVDVGWFSHDDPFEFDIHHFKYAKTALRFLGGTPSILPLYVATSGINTILKMGIERIYQHNQALIDQLLQQVLSLGFCINSPIERFKRGGTLVIAFEDPKKAMALFAHKGILVDERPRFGARFSPHIYTAEHDIQTVIQALQQLLHPE